MHFYFLKSANFVEVKQNNKFQTLLSWIICIYPLHWVLLIIWKWLWNSLQECSGTFSLSYDKGRQYFLLNLTSRKQSNILSLFTSVVITYFDYAEVTQNLAKWLVLLFKVQNDKNKWVDYNDKRSLFHFTLHTSRRE